jgi:hypothetical protein
MLNLDAEILVLSADLTLTNALIISRRQKDHKNAKAWTNEVLAATTVKKEYE